MLTQDGNRVNGTVHLGSMQGTLNGNIMTGVFSDINVRGQFQITFSSDGTRFQGGIQTSNGIERWTGLRTGTLATTPEGIMRSRSRLDDVQGSSDSYEVQAQKACRNLFAAVYVSSNNDWITSRVVGPNPFTQVLGAPSQTTQYAQVRGLTVAPTRSDPPPTAAAAANGFQYKGTVTMAGSIFRVFNGGAWSSWQDIRNYIFLCTYQIRNGTASIMALDNMLGVAVEQLTRPTAIPPG